jgi:SynChlorMet cassette radical SAM/SPASM protein ScmF
MEKQVNLPDGVPPLLQYYVYLTAGCNLACQHCWLSPVYQPYGTTGGHLDYDLFKLALEEGIPLGLRSVKLTGGEPLLHPDFLRIIDLIKEMNLNAYIETNATLMTPEIATHLKENSTVNFISVSLDGAKSETHDSFRGVKGSYNKAVAGLKMLTDVGYHPQVIMSLHNGNVNEIEELVHLAEGWGAGSVKFNLVQPTGRGEIMSDKGQVLNITQLVSIGKWVEGNLQHKVKIPLYYSWPIIFYSLERLLNQGNGCCTIFNILGILSNGSLAMCGIGMEIPELTYGYLGKDHVLDVWGKNLILNNMRLDLPEKFEGVCGECIFKFICLGSCIAENYHQSHNLQSPFWFCQEAQLAGIIPQQRLKTELNILNQVPYSRSLKNKERKLS